MKRSLVVPILLLAGLCVLAGTASPQAPKKAGIVGTWVGTATVNEDGTGMDITVVVGKAESGYTGKLSDASGAIPETELRDVVFKDNKLTCAFDLPEAMGGSLITIELTLEGETLKGVWFDPEGNSGAIELSLKK
ncbi:MAG: hypothetical protein EHM31_06155 [Candidatus Aminicenantes bacterium]|nr:MAG: hypothetical protein EHM31_06155 [Candidatus Aminicenantes bacterium]